MSTVIHGLLNDPQTFLFHFLLIQEPYIFPASSRLISNSGWVPILPYVPDSTSDLSPEDTTIKSLIYVNKHIPSTLLTPVNMLSNCISAVSYSLQTHKFLLISAYAPPKQTQKLKELYDLLRIHPSTASKHHIVRMDSNLHHPLWNPTTYKHKHCEADDLIDRMSEAGLGPRSTSGIPTFYPPQHHPCQHYDRLNLAIADMPRMGNHLPNRCEPRVLPPVGPRRNHNVHNNTLTDPNNSQITSKLEEDGPRLL